MADVPGIPVIGQKTETRKGGWFEDVQRPAAQTGLLVVFRLVIYSSIFGELWLCARSVEWWMSLGMPDILKSHEATGVMVVIFYALLIFSGVFYAGVNIVKWIDAELSRDAFAIMSVASVIIIGLTAFWLPGVDWLVWAVKTDVVIFIGGIVTMAVVNSLPTGTYSVAQELLQQARTNSEQVQLELVKQEFEREKRGLGDDYQVALDEIESLNERITYLTEENKKLKSMPVKEFLPYNHGSARSLPIGARSFMPEEQERLSRWIASWPIRGTSRDNWTTRQAEQRWGWRLSEPEWDKFIDALKGLKYLDDNNKPLLKPEDVIKAVKLPPCSIETASGENGNGKNAVIPDPTRPDPTGNGSVVG